MERRFFVPRNHSLPDDDVYPYAHAPHRDTIEAKYAAENETGFNGLLIALMVAATAIFWFIAFRLWRQTAPVRALPEIPARAPLLLPNRQFILDDAPAVVVIEAPEGARAAAPADAAGAVALRQP